MESKATIKSNKIELIQKAIEQLTESSSVDDRSDEDLYLLAKLLSQLESLKEDVILKPSDSEPSTAEPNEVPSCAFGEVEVKSKENTNPSSSNRDAGSEDVVKELKKLGRQNTITHLLLSGLIVLTLAWQLSEYSLLLKLKNGVTHPFKSFGSMVTGVVKRHKELKEVLDGDSQSSTKQKENKLLNMDITSMLMNGNEE